MLEKLTKEQAIIISGYTGVMCCAFNLLHEDVERRLGRSVFIHEFGSAGLGDTVSQLYRADFLALCHE